MSLSFPPRVAFMVGLRMVGLAILCAIRRRSVDLEIVL